MHAAYFTVLARGMSGELERLSGDEVLEHLDNHRSQLLLDPSLCSCYAARLAAEPGLGSKPRMVAALAALLAKRLRLEPFDEQAARALARIAGDNEAAVRADLLASLNAEPDGLKDILALDEPDERLETEPVLRTLLRVYPSYVQVADLLLDLDLRRGRAPGDWLASFRCPGPLEAAWRARLFAHHATLGLRAGADALWAGLPQAVRDETLCNLAASLRLSAGEYEAAASMLRASLALDPSQTPIALRLAELDRPTPLDPALIRDRSVVVCLYTFNKAALLERTLASLAASDLGAAKVRLLLNGCSDHSRRVADTARALFPDNDFQVVDLPVNVGAPAARNWLAALPECREADSVAYLDDDVEIPADWLGRFLSVAEADPGIGVVGCKVLDPGNPARLQYLYRNVALARPDLFKLSIHAPVGALDLGLYDYTRETMSVMGCCHLLRGRALRELPGFDIRFNPSQGDDLDHDLAACLAGWRVVYTGTVACVHHQAAGFSGTGAVERKRAGNIIGNDLKLCAKHMEHLDRLRELAFEDRERARNGADWRGSQA